MKKFFFLAILFFQYTFLIGQQLEADIYDAVDAFVANKNETSLLELNKKEAIFTTSVSKKKEFLALVILQCNKAYYLKEKQKIIPAITAYEKASQHFFNEGLEGYDIIEYCLKPLGNLYTITKNYTNAEHTIKQYVFLANKDNNRNQKKSGIINLCRLYQSMGKHSLVVKTIAEVLKKKTIDAKYKRKLLELKIISSIALKDTNKQDELIFKNASESNYRLAMERKDYKKALCFWNEIKKEQFAFKEFSNREKAKLYFEEAQLFYLLNELDKAKRNNQKALLILLPDLLENEFPTKEVLYPENTFIAIFDLNARLASETDSILKNYELSFYVSELLQQQITSQEAKIINQAENRNRSESYLEVLFTAYNETRDEKYLLKAFQHTEKRKAKILSDISIKNTLLEKFPSDNLLLYEKKLLSTQEGLTNLLIDEQLKGNRSSKINLFNKELQELSIQLREVQKSIEEKYGIQKNSIFKVAEIQSKLNDEKAVLVVYFYGKKSIYQFIVSKENIAFNQIPLTEEIYATIVSYNRFFENSSMINNDVEFFKQQSNKLYRLLQFNLLKKQHKVVLVLDGLLNFIPFETLLTEKNDVVNYAQMPFVIKQQEIVYSLNVKLFLLKRKKTNVQKVLGVFPVFLKSEKELMYSKEEAKSINECMDSKILMNKEATKENFITNSSSYSILHLSTHASGGDFTQPATIDFYDGKISLNELYSYNFLTDLVVLSACETGVGELKKGEGAMSIARGFQYAGVKNVLFSLWKINDKSTAILMRYFYKEYQKTTNVSYANRISKVNYLKEKTIPNYKKSPYFWGAFVYYGTLESSMQPNKQTMYFMWLILLIVISLCLYYINRFYQPKKSK